MYKTPEEKKRRNKEAGRNNIPEAATWAALDSLCDFGSFGGED